MHFLGVACFSALVMLILVFLLYLGISACMSMRSLFSNQQTSFVTCFANAGDVLRVLAPAGTHVFDMFNVCGPPQSVFSRFRAPPQVRFVAPLQRFPGLRFLVFEVVGHRNCIESHMLRALLP